MKYCFLFAMEAEASFLLSSSEILSTERLGNATVRSCRYGGKEFLVAVSGIGKVLASSGATAVCVAHPEVDALINLGIGGSLDAAKAPCLSAVLASDFAQHDMDTTPFGDPIGYLYGPDRVKIDADEGLNRDLAAICTEMGIPVTSAPIASGDQFIVDENVKSVIVERFGALSVDMEAAAFAEVCFVYGKPFTALRIVSDAVDHHNEYLINKPIAGKMACEVGMGLLRRCA